MMKPILITFLLSLCWQVDAQVLDSLNSIWSDQNQHDTIRLEALEELAWELEYSDPDSCIKVLDIMKGYAESVNSVRWLAKSWYLRGNQAMSAGNVDRSEKNYLKAIRIFDQDKDKLYIGKTRVALGVLFMRTGKFDQAEKENLAALALFKEVGHKGGANTVYGNLGSIALGRSQIQKALDYFTAALEIAEEIGKTRGVIYSLNDLSQVTLTQDHFEEALSYGKKGLELAKKEGDPYLKAMIYHQISTIYFRKKDYSLSMNYLDSSLDISQEFNIINFQARSIEIYGSIHEQLDDYNKAITAFRSAVLLYEQVGDQFAQYQTTAFIAESYLKLGELDSATYYALKSFEGGKTVGSPFIVSTSTKTLHTIYDKQGRHKDAYDMYQIYVSMRDSTENMENDKAAIRQEEKYRYEKERLFEAQQNEQKAERLKQKTLTTEQAVIEKESERDFLLNLIIILALLAILIITIAVAIRIRRKSHEITQEKLLRSRMAKELVYWQEEERKQIAHDLHDGLGQRLSLIKNSLQGATWEETNIIASVGAAIQEVRDVSDALRPRQLDTLGLKAAIEVLIDDTFGQTEVKIQSNIAEVSGLLTDDCEVSVYRIIQEAINNIVKYAKCNHLEVSVDLQNKLTIRIEDDGIGFDPETVKHTKQGGFGLKGMQERVNFLEGDLKIKSSPGNGTQVEIDIPLEHHLANQA